MYITFKRSIMQSCKFILHCFQIYPFSYIVLVHFFFSLSNNSLKNCSSIIKCTHMKQSVSFIVNNFINFDLVGNLIQIFNKIFRTIPLNYSTTFRCSFFYKSFCFTFGPSLFQSYILSTSIPIG